MLNALKSFGHTIGQEWYEMPIFYFTNHHGIYGPDDEIKRPTGETKLDIELEIACIICEGNYNTVYYTFGQMIERASENNVTMMSGDILGSETVDLGSLIENNFTVHRPLEPGDVVELEIEGIGVLRNKVI